MLPVDVFLDSSSVRGELNPRSATLKRLAALVEEGIVQVHVHELVRQEVATGVAADLLAPVRELLKQIDWSHPHGSALGEQLRALKEGATTTVAEGVKAVLTRIGAREHALAPATAVDVFKSYFSGGPPFGKTKNREDIPDAFLFHAITALKASTPELHVVCADKRFRAAVENLGLASFARVLDFLESDAVKDALRDLQDEREGALELYLREKQERAEVGNALTNAKDHIRTEALGFLRDQMPIEVVHSRIPSDSHDATVNDLGDLDAFELVTEEIDSLGGGEVVLPIDLTFPDVSLDFDVFRGSLSELDEEQLAWTGGVWNDHYVEGEVIASLRVRLAARVQMERHEEGEDLDVISASFDGVDSVEVLEFVS